MDLITRRQLFKSTGVIAVGLVTPTWLSTIARADLLTQAKGGQKNRKTVLVVCQLTGGNDGLNTVIPYSDPLYRKFRSQIGIPEETILKINDRVGFHPAMKGLHTLYNEGKVAVIQNVGYPDPNRSHFKSMDIWQSGSPSLSAKGGWIGRFIDSTSSSNPICAIGLSVEKPRALTAERSSIPCFASLTDVQNMVGDADTERLLRQVKGQGASGKVVADANRSALDAINALQSKLSTYSPTETYGNDTFGQGFKQIAQLIATSPETRVVYFSSGGFDTHARQGETHQRLLKGFSDAVLAFQREIEKVAKDTNVVLMVFSEFGRRVEENGSLGTDHGAAAPMFLVGSNVKGGLHGPIPALNDLDNKGDLKFTTDFREVYATTVDQWLGGDSEVLFGQKFGSIDVLK